MMLYTFFKVAVNSCNFCTHGFPGTNSSWNFVPGYIYHHRPGIAHSCYLGDSTIDFTTKWSFPNICIPDSGGAIKTFPGIVHIQIQLEFVKKGQGETAETAEMAEMAETTEK